MADMLWRVRVRIGGCHEIFSMSGLRISLTDFRPGPFFLPFPFQSTPVELGQSLCHFLGDWNGQLFADAVLYDLQSFRSFGF